MNTCNPLLNIQNLHVHFSTYEGTAKVINGIDFVIEEGETIALVGESGCGKSTLGQAILGLLPQPPAGIPRGEIRFRGTDLLSLSDAERHARRGTEISMIMQNPMTALNPVYTVGEQMVDIIKWQGKKRMSLFGWIRDKFNDHSALRERALEMLEQVQISAPKRIFDSYPIELSGGMRQRVIIGMALLADPDLLIADEPGTAIDVTTEAKILDLLSDLVEETGTSILYITHDLGVAFEVAEDVNVMYAGEIVERASTDDLFKSPMHPYTRGLLDSVPKLATGTGSGIEGRLPDYTNPPEACRFVDRCPHAAAECDQVYPYPRAVTDNHHVACHLYQGQPTNERDKSIARNHNVDIGEPPWFTQDSLTASKSSQRVSSNGGTDDE